MTDQTITLTHEENKPFQGYLFTPPTPDKKPGIVLLQDIFGVNSAMRVIANQFAKEGYTVLVPDLFWRIAPDIQLNYEGQDLEQAFNCHQRYDIKQGLKDIGLTLETLRHHPTCSGQVALIGFSFGAKLAYLTATMSPYELDGIVTFYGVGIADHLKAAENIDAPMLMHFGEKDEMVSHDQVDRVKRAFRHVENVSIHVYPKVGHAFYIPTRSSYDATVASLAHDRTLSFLRRVLMAEAPAPVS